MPPNGTTRAQTSVTETSAPTASTSAVRLDAGSRWLKDEHNRVVLLRGVSLSGVNKLPVGTLKGGGTHDESAFKDHRAVSFVGRPFPLDEAHDHLSRLQQWGLTFIRLVVTWEALEHAGPGSYDVEYITYLHQLLQLFPRYGLLAFIDAHQDVWSRLCGGSGAPGWTLELAGFDLAALKGTNAAHVHSDNLAPGDPPSKVWPSGYMKLAPATLNTLFWAGDTFAPELKRIPWREHKELGKSRAGDASIEQFMQDSMIEAFGQLADALAGLPCVVGFEVMNEPHRGYVELHSVYAWDENTDLSIGYVPTALQSWALGAGHPTLVPHYIQSFPVTAVSHSVVLSPTRPVWREGHSCPWQQHGVWSWDEQKKRPEVLKIDYFTHHPTTGKEVEWYKDFYHPFCVRYAEKMARARSSYWSLVGPIPNEFAISWPHDERPKELVYAPHWYDLQSLFEKKSGGWMSANVQGLSRGMPFWKGLYFGRQGLRENYSTQIGNIVSKAYAAIGEVPIVLGETGLPFDSNGRSGLLHKKWAPQEMQMDAILCAIDKALVGVNLWNYNPVNENTFGDAWNMENFSIFSLSEVSKELLAAAKTDEERLNVGARLLNAVERPYPRVTAGVPKSFFYEYRSLEFVYEWSNDPNLRLAEKERRTEMHLPRRRYGVPFKNGKLSVKLSDGTWEYDPETQTLLITHANTSPGFRHHISLSVAGFSVAQGGGWWLHGAVVVLSLLIGLVWQGAGGFGSVDWTFLWAWLEAGL